MSRQHAEFILPQPEAPWWRALARALRRGALARRRNWAGAARKKQWNAALNWREFWHGRTRLASFPRLVQVGTNWTCNLQCSFCRLPRPWTQAEIRRRSRDQLQLSERVLETVRRLLPYAETMTLTPLGEPLMWPGLKDFLDYYQRLGSGNLALTSNGMLLGEGMAERLVRARLHDLYLSIDSNDPEVYASMRVGGDLRKVEAGVRRVREWKDKLASPWPLMTINATFMARNIGQLPAMVDWARGLGAAALSVQLMEIENPEQEREFLGLHPERARAAVAQALARGLELGFPVLPHPAILNLIEALGTRAAPIGPEYAAASPILPEGLRHGAQAGPEGERVVNDPGAGNGKTLIEKCAFPWHNLLIDTDGDARPCCWADVSWGNLNELPFEEIWNGPTARAMRAAFIRNAIPPSCRKKHCRVDLS